jgi:mannosylglycerate hydrolase
MPAAHIKNIRVVSNTHWDREWRESFELTRQMLVKMMDKTIALLEDNADYRSFTLDGQCIPVEDYLEIRPENASRVKKLIRDGRLIIGPYYTLAEQFSISQEPLVRNLLWGRKKMQEYGSGTVTVAYTPSSWGQTGQYPQILADFGLSRVMFYRGISHDEAPKAEYIWSAPDGTRLVASRFGIYARYNWYYYILRKSTRSDDHKDKKYIWGKFDEIPFRIADYFSGTNQGFHIKASDVTFDADAVKRGVAQMLSEEGPHCSTDMFLGMNGNDLSAPHPLETAIMRCAAEQYKDLDIRHASLEEYWDELEPKLDKQKLPVLTGERRSYLKTGLWTTLMPDTISARTDLKQKDFDVSTRLVYLAEPLASLASALGSAYPAGYLGKCWQYLLSNHTHDSNGGCAPDEVCKDMEYRYKKVYDISNIVTQDAMSYVAENLSPEGVAADAVQLIVFNSLPRPRDAIVALDIDIPFDPKANFVALSARQDPDVPCQLISCGASKQFVDNMYDAPGFMDTTKVRVHAQLTGIPALGYRVYTVKPEAHTPRHRQTMICGNNAMENACLKVVVNGNGTVDVTNKKTGRLYQGLNYLTDEGECGNAWVHERPVNDIRLNSLGVQATIGIVESGHLSSTIRVEYDVLVPAEGVAKSGRSEKKAILHVTSSYTLEKDSHVLKVRTTVDNTAKDHVLRINLPTRLKTDRTWTDSHFDVLSHPIAVPDSTGWLEEARGTHPLRTFVDLADGTDGLALFSKGVFEYEVLEDADTTLALTLIRACRVIQPIGPLPNTLPDLGIQSPGLQQYEYAFCFHEKGWSEAGILAQAAAYIAPVRPAISGRGKGSLPHEGSFFSLQNTQLSVTCVKQAEDGNGIIVRLFNPLAEEQRAVFAFDRALKSAALTKMDESTISELEVDQGVVRCAVEAKKIRTFRFVCQ